MLRRAVVIASVVGAVCVSAWGQPGGGDVGGPGPRRRPAPVDDQEFRPTPLSEIARARPRLTSDVLASWTKIERRWLLEEGVLNGAKGDEPWIGPVREFLEPLGAFYSGEGSGTKWEQSLEKLEAARLAWCMHPVLDLAGLHAKTLAGRGDELEFMGISARIDAADQAGAAPMRLALWAFWASQRVRSFDADQADRLQVRGVELALKAAARQDMSADEQRLVFAKIQARVEDELPSEMAKLMAERLFASEAPEWLRLMVRGSWSIRAAWDARGRGYVSRVSPEQWAGFERWMRSAARDLTRAHELAPDRPEAATLMIKVAMAGEDPRGLPERYWFEQSARAQLDFPPAATAYLWALRPRWGGSTRRMIDFGRECARVREPLSLLPWQLPVAVADVCHDDDDFDAVWNELPGIADECLESLEWLASTARFEGGRAQYLLSAASAAFRAGQWDDLVRLHEAWQSLRRTEEMSASDRFRVNLKELRVHAYARENAATRVLVNKSVDAMDRGEYAAALAALDEVSKTPGEASKVQATALRWLRARAEVGAALASGEPAHIPTDSDEGWLERGIGFQSAGEDGARGPLRARVGPAMSTFDLPLGQRWLADAVIEIERPKGRGPTTKPRGRVGLIFGYSWRSRVRYGTALVAPSTGQVTLSDGFGKSNPAVAEVSLPRFRLSVAKFDDRMMVWVDGKLVIQAADPREGEARIGEVIGVTIADGEFPGVLVRGLTVRRLESMPDAADLGHAAGGPPALAPPDAVKNP